MKNFHRAESVRLRLVLVLTGLVCAASAFAQGFRGPDPGQLIITGRSGAVVAPCPLKHTVVNADIAGFGARVHVVQTFTNPSSTPIEAVYTFPLPHDAAVDRMRIKVGSRVIEGQIKRREEAQRIYDAAKNAGQVAGLLDQERPNIFTQSIANIMPNAVVQVDISYVQILNYENGQFEFVFPMVVGPRYTGHTIDPEKVAPPIVPERTRSGTTVDLNVRIDAGAPIVGLNSVLHQVSVERADDRHVSVTLTKENEIPNRDFILRYQTATNGVQSAFVTTYDGNKGGFFNLILLPPKTPKSEDICPREMIFVVDKSGSQMGFPIEKSKELTYKLLKTMRQGDTFNVYSFNTAVQQLWSHPKVFNAENLAEAHRFLDPIQAGGGTDILGVMHAVLTASKDAERLRVVLFNTDGFVGDEQFIIPEIKKHNAHTRIFTFGIGNSVNRYLIDAMSKAGKGDSEIVTLAESAEPAVNQFVQRLRTPVLTNVRFETDGIDLTQVTPSEIPDVFSDRPIVIQGRFENPGHGRISLSGQVGERSWSQSLHLPFTPDPGDSAIATLWARRQVDELTNRSYEQQIGEAGIERADYESEITDLGLQFGIMTQYTSFVAVEPRVVNIDGVSHTVHVPIEMADGVSYQGIFGAPASPAVTLSAAIAAPGGGGGAGPGGMAGFGGGRGTVSGRITRHISAGKAMKSTSGQAMLEDRSDKPAVNVRTYEKVVDKRLRSAKNQVAVLVYLTALDDDLLAKLKGLGLRVSEVDRKLRLVIGSCSVDKLRALVVKVTEIERIAPVE
ncbi:MAG: VIT and VWA domain-containing protein [Fimbriimonas sp.]|nr:VIT and VWA domain-containing protein [Fimbriimonas sp.]